MSIGALWVGIDVSSRWFDACALAREGRKEARFRNDEEGFCALLSFLGPGDWHLCLEGTGGYERALCEFLDRSGVRFTRVDSLLARRFAEGLGLLHKTDRLDARALAEYGRLKSPEPSRLESEARRELRQLVRALEDLKLQRLQIQARLRSPALPRAALYAFETAARGLEEAIRQLHARIDERLEGELELAEDVRLLQSIRGVGRVSALKILAYLPEGPLRSARGLARYAGVAPASRESGSSVRARPGIDERCSHELRSALFMCGMVARRCCPFLRGFALKLLERGKAKKQAIVAVMRKLAHAIYAVLTRREPYDGAKLCRKT